MEILLAVAAWFGLSAVAAIGWSRFHRAVGPTPTREVEERTRTVA